MLDTKMTASDDEFLYGSDTTTDNSDYEDGHDNEDQIDFIALATGNVVSPKAAGRSPSSSSSSNNSNSRSRGRTRAMDTLKPPSSSSSTSNSGNNGNHSRNIGRSNSAQLPQKLQHRRSRSATSGTTRVNRSTSARCVPSSPPNKNSSNLKAHTKKDHFQPYGVRKQQFNAAPLMNGAIGGERRSTAELRPLRTSPMVRSRGIS